MDSTLTGWMHRNKVHRLASLVPPPRRGKPRRRHPLHAGHGPLGRRPRADGRPRYVCTSILVLAPLLTLARPARSRWRLHVVVGRHLVGPFRLARLLDCRYVDLCAPLVLPSALTMCIDCPAIHSYHVLFFKLTFDELWHHFLFVPGVGIYGGLCQLGTSPPCAVRRTARPLTSLPPSPDSNVGCRNVTAFFMSGLPGGISYVNLGTRPRPVSSSVPATDTARRSSRQAGHAGQGEGEADQRVDQPMDSRPRTRKLAAPPPPWPPPLTPRRPPQLLIAATEYALLLYVRRDVPIYVAVIIIGLTVYNGVHYMGEAIENAAVRLTEARVKAKKA